MKNRIVFATLLSFGFLIGFLGCKASKKPDVEIQTPVVIEKAEIEVPEQEQFWNDIPDFDLPFDIVYQGLIVKSDLYPLRKGFSHMCKGNYANAFGKNIPVDQRAIIWTGIAYSAKGEPWGRTKSPWGNSLPKFEAVWKRRLAAMSEHYGEPGGYPNADIIMMDFESELYGSNILKLKKDTSISPSLRNRTDAEFRKAYEKAMIDLCNIPTELLKKNTDARLSGYGNVPATRTWYGIEKRSDDIWKDSGKLINYLGKPSAANDFEKNLDFISPSAYFFNGDARNIAYALFQVEINKLHSNKPLMLCVTPRYVGSATYGNPIAPHFAEAMAIFPFFSGAEGLWFYENSKHKRLHSPKIEAAYVAFVSGLHRLSQHKEFFEGNHELVIQKSARQHFLDKDPIWRGVKKGNKLLVVAQNPYAKADEEVNLQIEFQGKNFNLPLKGKEIELTEFNL